MERFLIWLCVRQFKEPEASAYRSRGSTCGAVMRLRPGFFDTVAAITRLLFESDWHVRVCCIQEHPHFAVKKIIEFATDDFRSPSIY